MSLTFRRTLFHFLFMILSKKNIYFTRVIASCPLSQVWQNYLPLILYNDPSGASMQADSHLDDINRVALKLLNYDFVKECIGKSEFSIQTPQGEFTWKNTNEFLDENSPYYNANVKGMKTGTMASSYNIVRFPANSDNGGTKGAPPATVRSAPLAPLPRLSLHTHKNSTPAVGVCTILRVYYLSGGTHSHLPLDVMPGRGKGNQPCRSRRSGEKFTNEWDGMTPCSYTRKGGVIPEIMLPPTPHPHSQPFNTLVEQRGSFTRKPGTPTCRRLAPYPGYSPGNKPTCPGILPLLFQKECAGFCYP